VCFVFHRTQTVKFEYSIDCAFDNELDPLALNSQEFEYFLRTDKVSHTHNTQHTTHNTQHTTHNTQHTTHNTQHTTHNTQVS
jgi:hypothetical protein